MIEQKLEELKAKNSARAVINLGMGDVALPLAPSIVSAICKAVEEMGQTTKGYAPPKGICFCARRLPPMNLPMYGIGPEEIFVSDGANSDAANIQELFSVHCTVGITDPTYPVYLDTNIMAGRGDKIISIPCTEANRFVPQPPEAPLRFRLSLLAQQPDRRGDDQGAT